MSEERLDRLADDILPEAPRADHDEADQLLVVFCYIPILCLAPILRMGRDEGMRFHARQGLILFLIELCAGAFLIPSLATLFFRGVLLLCFIFALIGVISSLQGKRVSLPFIGDWAERIKR